MLLFSICHGSGAIATLKTKQIGGEKIMRGQEVLLPVVGVNLLVFLPFWATLSLHLCRQEQVMLK